MNFKMNSLRKLCHWSVGATVLVGAAGACDDLTPIYVDPTSLALVTVDAGDAATDAEGGTVGPTTPCAICIDDQVAGGAEGCAENNAPCWEDTKCEAMMLCILNRGCLELSAELMIGCSTPCSAAVGISEMTDPAVVRGLPVMTCAQTECADVCGFE